MMVIADPAIPLVELDAILATVSAAVGSSSPAGCDPPAVNGFNTVRAAVGSSVPLRGTPAGPIGFTNVTAAVVITAPVVGVPGVLSGFRNVTFAVVRTAPALEATRSKVLVPLIVPVTSKTVLLKAVPPAVVTATTPEVPPAGTVAVIEVEVLDTMVIGTPASATPVAPVKPVPVMVTFVPTAPLAGLNNVITGGMPVGAATVKLVALVAAPAGFATEILTAPRGAPAGTVAWIWVVEFTMKLAATALNVTDVVPTKLAPVMVTVVPTGPLAGVNDEIVGAKADGVVTVKLGISSAEVVAVPPGAVTEMNPVVALAGTTAVIEVSEFTVKSGAGAPLKATTVAPVKLVPVIVTLLPDAPLAGAKELIVTGGTTAAGIATLAIPKGFTSVPDATIGEANGVKGCKITKTVKCVTEAVRVVPSALSTAWKPVAWYCPLRGL